MTLINDKWDYHLDLRTVINEYDYQKVENWKEEKVQALKDITKSLNFSGNIAQTSNVDLASLIEKNKQCKQDIDNLLERLSKKQSQCEKFKQDRKLLSQEIKETHEAFLMAKKYYKKFLNIYYTIEKTTDKYQIIYLQFFTEDKEDNANYSIRLQRDLKTYQYELVDMKPMTKNFKEIQKKLQDSNDPLGALCYIRQTFKKLKKDQIKH